MKYVCYLYAHYGESSGKVTMVGIECDDATF